MSEITAEQQKENIDQKALELAQDFSYEGYQVVRRELFAHLREPAVVIRRDSVTFNTACIAGLEDAVYIQILVNQDNKRMVVRKCEENDKDALRWCVEKPDKRKSRKMTNKLFSAMIYDMMGWDLDCRYKMQGYKITHEDKTMYIFDLLEPEIYMDTKKKRKKALHHRKLSSGEEPFAYMNLCIYINADTRFQFNSDAVIPECDLLDPASHQ